MFLDLASPDRPPGIAPGSLRVQPNRPTAGSVGAGGPRGAGERSEAGGGRGHQLGAAAEPGPDGDAGGIAGPSSGRRARVGYARNANASSSCGEASGGRDEILVIPPSSPDPAGLRARPHGLAAPAPRSGDRPRQDGSRVRPVGRLKLTKVTSCRPPARAPPASGFRARPRPTRRPPAARPADRSPNEEVPDDSRIGDRPYQPFYGDSGEPRQDINRGRGTRRGDHQQSRADAMCRPGDPGRRSSSRAVL